jgi:hypothetical protein
VPLLIVTLVEDVGTPVGDQLVDVFQSVKAPEVPPTQSDGGVVVVNREVVVIAVPEQVALVAITCTS